VGASHRRGRRDDIPFRIDRSSVHERQRRGLPLID
jgi:hypothetical protein